MAAAVPFAMKAAPWIASGVGSWLGKKASGPSKMQQTGMAQTQQAGENLSRISAPTMASGQNLIRSGSGMLSRGAEEMAPAASYYRNVLGSRSTANAALSPERSTALEYYKGAEGKLKRTMRGPARDAQIAELDRQKAGQLASYLPQARRMGAEGLERVGSAYGGMGATSLGAGTSLTGQGINAATSGAYIGSGLFNQASQVKEQEQAGGRSWGNLLYDMAGTLFGGKGKSPLPSSRLPISSLYTGPSAR